MVWGGLSAPQPTRGSRERRELPQCGVRGGAPAAVAFSAYLGHRTLLRGSKKDTILHFEKSGGDSQQHHCQKWHGDKSPSSHTKLRLRDVPNVTGTLMYTSASCVINKLTELFL